MIHSLTEISNERAILITGASGLVGSGIIGLLQHHDRDRAIVALARQPDALPKLPGVIAIHGDLSRENLGLDEASANALHQRVTEIIHCAADVKFNATLESSRSVNVEGTRRLLEFAARCPKLEKFAHVSTLYIAGKRPGTIVEQELRHDFGYFNAYEQSKHEAEHLVFSWMQRLPISIYRLSAIIGHSQTGEITQKNFFHSLIALAPRASSLPCLPIDPSAPVDLIANDWCCESLVLLFDTYFRAGSVHHLCAGTRYSLTAGELIDTVFDVIEERTGERIVKPPLGQWSDIEQHRKLRSGGNEGAMLDLVSKFFPHMAVNQPFDRGDTGMVLERNQLIPPQPSEFVGQVIRQTVPLYRPEFALT